MAFKNNQSNDSNVMIPFGTLINEPLSCSLVVTKMTSIKMSVANDDKSLFNFSILLFLTSIFPSFCSEHDKKTTVMALQWLINTPSSLLMMSSNNQQIREVKLYFDFFALG